MPERIVVNKNVSSLAIDFNLILAVGGKLN